MKNVTKWFNKTAEFYNLHEANMALVPDVILLYLKLPLKSLTEFHHVFILQNVVSCAVKTIRHDSRWKFRRLFSH